MLFIGAYRPFEKCKVEKLSQVNYPKYLKMDGTIMFASPVPHLSTTSTSAMLPVIFPTFASSSLLFYIISFTPSDTPRAKSMVTVGIVRDMKMKMKRTNSYHR
jgi:hypothetical protein